MQRRTQLRSNQMWSKSNRSIHRTTKWRSVTSNHRRMSTWKSPNHIKRPMPSRTYHERSSPPPIHRHRHWSATIMCTKAPQRQPLSATLTQNIATFAISNSIFSTLISRTSNSTAKQPRMHLMRPQPIDRRPVKRHPLLHAPLKRLCCNELFVALNIEHPFRYTGIIDVKSISHMNMIDIELVLLYYQNGLKSISLNSLFVDTQTTN